MHPQDAGGILRFAFVFCLLLTTAVLMTGCGHGVCKKKCGGGGGGGEGGGNPGAGQGQNNPGAGNHNNGNQNQGRPVAPPRLNDPGLNDPGLNDPGLNDPELNNPDIDPNDDNLNDPDGSNPDETPSPSRTPGGDPSPEPPAPTRAVKQTTAYQCGQASPGTPAHTAVATLREPTKTASIEKLIKEGSVEQRQEALSCLLVGYRGLETDQKILVRKIIGELLGTGGLNPNQMVSVSVTGSTDPMKVPLAAVAIMQDDEALLRFISGTAGFNPTFVGEGQTESLLYTAVLRGKLELVNLLLAKHEGRKEPVTTNKLKAEALSLAVQRMLTSADQQQREAYEKIAMAMATNLPAGDPVFSNSMFGLDSTLPLAQLKTDQAVVGDTRDYPHNGLMALIQGKILPKLD